MAKKNVGVHKIGQKRVFYVTERSARGLVRTGRFDYADTPVANVVAAPSAPVNAPKEESSDGLEDLSYWDLHRRVQALEEELRPEGRTKADYIRALREAGG